MSFPRSARLVLTTGVVFVCAAPRIAFGDPPDPCSLLTQAQVNAALGGSVGAGVALGTTVCRWAEPNGRPGRIPAVVVTIQDEREFNFAKAPAGTAIVKTPVSSVGDDAVLITVGSITATLSVKKGDTYFAIHVYGFPVAQTQSIEKELAKEIVSKLKA